MRPHQIEAWALRVIEAFQKGAPTEDSRVELKAQWPEPKKAARQIAGHANAAHGEPVLWLIGVDEKGKVTGAEREELSKWWPQIESQFDGLAPRIVEINVPIDGMTIVALKIETDRAPFVIINPAANMDREVPWREGTRVRSARRADLIRLLEPLEKLPEIDILWAYCSKDYFTCCLFVSPPADCRLVIPVHHCFGLISSTKGDDRVPLSDIRLLEKFLDSSNWGRNCTEVAVDTPRQLGMRADLDPNLMSRLQTEDVVLSLDLKPASFQRAATATAVLLWSQETQSWELNQIKWAELGSGFFIP
jgi:hypothetical protein